MTGNNIQKFIEETISHSLGKKISSIQFKTIAGGSINETYQIIVNKSQSIFCKINSAQKYPSLFIKEKNGLALLSQQNLVRTPGIFGCEETDGKQILILEWIEQGVRTEKFWKTFGEQLAALHTISWSDGFHQTNFGLFEDNYLGSLQQSNSPSKSWNDFFIYQRLEPQIKLGLDNHLLDAKYLPPFRRLFKQLPTIFPEESSSLLHGDLWSGNFLCSQSGEPVFIDPAAYFGHRSIDLGMTTLFGSLDREFYESYNYHFPFPQNYREQWEICNLYPLLAHLNLFGKGYLTNILRIIQHF